jgi:hypothetical protein
VLLAVVMGSRVAVMRRALVVVVLVAVATAGPSVGWPVVTAASVRSVRRAHDVLPPGIRSIAIAAVRPDNGRAYPLGIATSPTQVRRIVEWIEALPLAGQRSPQLPPCPLPAYDQPFYRLTFLGRGRRAELAQAIETGCPQDIALSVRGRSEPRLAERTAVDALLWSVNALDVCQPRQLAAVSPVSAFEDPTHTFQLLALLKNSSRRACSIRGLARVTLLDADRHALRTRATSDADREVVTLIPGGEGGTGLRWPQPTCPAPTARFVRLGFSRPPITVVFSEASDGATIAPCAGRMAETPIAPQAPFFFPPGSPLAGSQSSRRQSMIPPIG